MAPPHTSRPAGRSSARPLTTFSYTAANNAQVIRHSMIGGAANFASTSRDSMAGTGGHSPVGHSHTYRVRVQREREQSASTTATSEESTRRTRCIDTLSGTDISSLARDHRATMFGGSALAIKTRTNPPKPPPKPDTLAFAELAATFGARPSAQLKSATVRQPRVRRKKPDGSAVASETLATPTSNRVSVLAREEKLDNAQDEQKVQQDAHEVLDEQNVMEDEQDEEEEHATDLHLAIALYDFHCAEDAERELTFSKNDLVLVTNVSRGIDGWWEGYVLGSCEDKTVLRDILGESNIDAETLDDDASAVTIGDFFEFVSASSPGTIVRVTGTRAHNWLQHIAVNFEALQESLPQRGKQHGWIPESYLQLLASPFLSVIMTGDRDAREERSPLMEPSNVQFSGATFEEHLSTGRGADDGSGSDPPAHDAATSLALLPYVQRSLNRFSPFVVSGAEDFVLGVGEDLVPKMKVISKTAPMFQSTPSRAPASLTSTLFNFVSSFIGGTAAVSGEPNSASGERECTVAGEHTSTTAPSTSLPTGNIHYITDGPSWAASEPSSSFMSVSVGNPTHQSGLLREWTTFDVESTTTAAAPDFHRTLVQRRYNHFHLLHSYLVQKFPMLLVPTLPPKQYSGRFRDEFLERRMRALARWLARVVRHPIMAASDAVALFLTAGAGLPAEESGRLLEEGMRKLGLGSALQLKHRRPEASTEVDQIANDDQQGWVDGMGVQATYVLDAKHVQGAAFYRHVYHPEYNLPPEAMRQSMASAEAFTEMEAFETITGDIEGVRDVHRFARSLSKRGQLLESTLGRYRDLLTNEYGRELRKVGMALQRMANSGGSADADGNRMSTATSADSTSTPEATTSSSENVWCHHGPTCKTCTNLTHSMQALAAGLTTLSTIYSDHATDTLNPVLELVSEWTEAADTRAAYVLNIHEEAAKIGRAVAFDARQSKDADEDPARQTDRLYLMARLQTVFNTTHAELDHWLHRERCLDWSDIVNTWIDGEMNALEEAMAVLRNCRAAVKSSTAQMDRNRIGGCG